MSFEKTYIDGPAREKIHQIEKHVTIERPDEPRFVTKNLEEIHEKSSSKSSKSKPKKNNPKTNKAAMETI